MATFQEKIDHACKSKSITVEELCTAIKINPFSLHLHATGQRPLEHNEMVLLCQYFDLMGNYFTNDNIRYIDEDLLDDDVRNLINKSGDKKGIICYEVIDENSPDMSQEDLIGMLNIIAGLKKE